MTKASFKKNVECISSSDLLSLLTARSSALLKKSQTKSNAELHIGKSVTVNTKVSTRRWRYIEEEEEQRGFLF